MNSKTVCTPLLVLLSTLVLAGCVSGKSPSPPPQNTDANNGASVLVGFKAVESEGRDEATGLWKEIEHIKTGIRLRLVPAGEFDMGGQAIYTKVVFVEGIGEEIAYNEDTHPAHHVKISRPFYMGKYELTQAQWKAVMGADNNPSKWQGDDLPVDSLSWNMAEDFLKEAGDGLRLPTEAEWEYACWAGSKGAGYDKMKLSDYAWYYPNSKDKTHPVGQKKPNAWGLYDMLGNVWEWCSDRYDDKYYEECKNGVTDPQGPEKGVHRVARGGSFYADGWSAHPAHRLMIPGPDAGGWYCGFRVVRDAGADN
jgi:formylglycine-generating enzyme required for sulfatase activity